LKAPLVGIHKVNWNAAVDTITGHMGLVVVVWDFEGCAIIARSLSKLESLEPIVVKALVVFLQPNLIRIWAYEIYYGR
jgi:hypothetical protein